jgi:hypothetical protein
MPAQTPKTTKTGEKKKSTRQLTGVELTVHVAKLIHKV